MQDPSFKRELHLCRAIFIFSSLPSESGHKNALNRHGFQSDILLLSLCMFTLFFSSHLSFNPLHPTRFTRRDYTPRLSSFTHTGSPSDSMHVLCCTTLSRKIVLHNCTNKREVKSTRGNRCAEQYRGQRRYRLFGAWRWDGRKAAQRRETYGCW